MVSGGLFHICCRVFSIRPLQKVIWILLENLLSHSLKKYDGTQNLNIIQNTQNIFPNMVLVTKKRKGHSNLTKL